MPPKAAPKGKKTKAEEAMDFLSNLDNLDAEAPPPSESPAPPTSAAVASAKQASVDLPRPSTDSARSKKVDLASDAPARASGEAAPTAEDEEAAKALAFLEAQINTKRAPLSVPGPGAVRATTPTQPAAAGSSSTANEGAERSPINQPTATVGGGGWGGGWWGAATSAIQSAQKMADEGYKKLQTEGAQGITNSVKGLDLEGLRKGAEERLAGITKGVDLEKLRHDLMSTTQSTLTTLLNTVAPPISAHETLELWLAHPMVGYSGVEGVIYRAWTRVLEQTESGELIVVWSEPEGPLPGKRGMYPVEGWAAGWKKADEGLTAVKGREETNPQGRKKEANVPVTIIPIFLFLQPVLAPLGIPEPPILTSSDAPAAAGPSDPPKHLQFIMVLADPTHKLRFTTVSQPAPADWLDVPYERSDWVEERLVDVLQTGVEILAQDYVATRMGLKSTGLTRPASPDPSKSTDAPKADSDAKDKKD